MILLLLAAGVPVIFLAISDAVQRRQAALDEGVADLRVRRAAFGAQLGATFSGLESLLHFALTDEAAGASAAECSAQLRRLLEDQAGRFGNLWRLRADGAVLCSALPGAPATALPDIRANASRTIRAEPARLAAGALVPASADAPAMLPIILAGQGGAIAGTLITSSLLPADALSASAQPVWLVDPVGNSVMLAGAPAAAPPPLSRQALSSGTIQTVSTAEAGSMAFGAVPVAAGLTVLVGQPASSARDTAWGTLIRRLVELTVFLLACLMLIVIAVDGAMVRPLRMLASRVKRWTPGKAFEPSSLRGAPREVTELEAAFASATEALGTREQALQSAVEHSEAMMGEIHHRVKNNLQIVSSLLNLQANRIADPAAQQEFRAARNRVRALATLHRHLYLQHSFEAIAIAPFLEELVNGQFTSQGEVPGERIQLTLELEPVSISADQAVSVALFTTEAVSNALSHAFPDDRDGELWVSFSTQGEEAVLGVRDNGIGLTGGARRGLGLQFLDSFARQLGGRLVAVEHGAGTAWQVSFPLRNKAEPPRTRGELQRRSAA
ncbi:sensor histidine kinase [Roseomonas elaeocarpi]|uniref:histidine kinase n=1 Tax=Roseomonas elaeocarpi TaxID=907779 RepID=A0ABV6JXF7_9PROT